MSNKPIAKTIFLAFCVLTLLPAQDGPLVAGEGEKKVITSGYGKNPDEALTQALRNAVEEAVGTYMTSTTRIENDDIIEDKILSLSRGFIKDFKKLSEMKVDGETKVTVAVIVTKTQILETLKASGVKVEIKGGLLFAQVSQEKEQMEDEANIIREYTKNIPQEHPFDYSLEYGTPVPQSDTRFKIPLKIKVSVNQNYHNQYANLKSFLNEISVERSLAPVDTEVSLDVNGDYAGRVNGRLFPRYKKQLTEPEIEKIEQRYGTRLSREYSDIFKNSSFSPYAVMLEESEDEIAYRLLNEDSTKSLETLIQHYFYNLRFTVIAQSTVKSKIPVNIFLSSPIKEIKQGGLARLEGHVGYEYKGRIKNDNFDIAKSIKIDGVSYNKATQFAPRYTTINLNDGYILNKEFLTLSFNLFVEEAFMASLSSLEVAPPLSWDGGPVTDIDGNTYKTVRIGSQIWMAENLKVTHYHNGDTIPTGLSEIEWIRAGVKISDQQKTDTWKANIGAYAVYDDNESNADTYGYLYNWHAVNDSRGLAPEGWHVPTNDEWITLTNYLGNVASRKLAGNADLWDNGMLKSYYDSTNKIRSEFGTSGFKALPGGIRHKQGGYFSMGNQCSFWSSTSRGDSQAWFRKLIYHNEGKFQDSYPYQAGFSVRCIRD